MGEEKSSELMPDFAILFLGEIQIIHYLIYEKCVSKSDWVWTTIHNLFITKVFCWGLVLDSQDGVAHGYNKH